MGTYRVAAVWQRACSRASAFRGSGRRPSSTARHGEASIVSVARVVPSAPRLEQDLGRELLLDVAPDEAALRFDGRDHDDALGLRPPEQADLAAAGDLPARALGKTAPVGAHGGVAGPPVGEMVRLGEERPRVGPGRDQLRLGFDPHARPTGGRRARGASCPGGRSARGDPARRAPRRRSRPAPRL